MILPQWMGRFSALFDPAHTRADWIKGRWANVALAFILGAITAFAMAPFHFWPLAALGFGGLMVHLDAAKGPRDGFFRGWAYGIGFCFFGLSWVSAAFLADPDRFLWLMPFAMTLLFSVVGLFWGVAGVAYVGLLKPTGLNGRATRLFLFAGVLGLTELARGTLFTGFPWNLPAYVWAAGGPMSQMGAVFGAYGTSVLTILLLAQWPLWFGPLTRRQRAILMGAGLALGGLWWGLGQYHLGKVSAYEASLPVGPTVAAQEAGFSMAQAMDPANSLPMANQYIDLLAAPQSQSAKIIVWPEGALPFIAQESPIFMEMVAAKLGNRALVLGSFRRETAKSDGQLRFYNSALLLEQANDNLRDAISHSILKVVSFDDKHHLVPFGEYLPFRKFLTKIGVAQFIFYPDDVAAGSAKNTLNLPGIGKADTRICYEIIFPDFNRQAVGRARLLLNISVDAWFGAGDGAAQHFNQARWRSIETGLPLVRAASGGFSAIVDGAGRAVAQSNKVGPDNVVAQLPVSLPSPLYDRYGLSLVFFVFGITFLVVWTHRRH